MNIASIEASLHKFLYDNFEVLLGIKVFESVYFVDFEAYDKWIVIDSLSHSTGALPKANYFLHLSVKNGLLNEKSILNRLCDSVTALINSGTRIEVYDEETAVLIGEMEVCSTSLVPVLQHSGGGSFRSLTVELVYAGDATSVAQ
jgi:hypothetical protein